MKEKYVSLCIENVVENIKMTRTKMLSIICDTWHDNTIITKQIIYKSFRVTGLDNKIDHSEDMLFNSWREMQNE